MTRFLRSAELEALLVARPDDGAACEVYADWLQQHGSPHGELISVQRALWREPRNVTLRRRESELLEAHGAELVGPSVVPQLHLLDWHGGFVRSAEVDQHKLPDLCRAPAGLLLRELVVWGETTLQPAIDLLAAVAPPLVKLELAIETYDTDLAHDVGDVRALWSVLRALERLELRAGAISLGEVAAAGLRELVLRPTTLTSESLRALASASLPALSHLELWLEHHDTDSPSEGDDYDRWAYQPSRSPIRLDDVARLLASPQLSSVRHLVIANTTLGDALCALIATSPLARQLHSLALVRGTVTEAGAAFLARNRAAFPQLGRLDLDRNRIAPGALLDDLPRDGTPWTQYPPGLPRCTL